MCRVPRPIRSYVYPALIQHFFTFAHRARGLLGTRRGMSYPAAAWTSTPSRALRLAAKRSETAGGTVDRLTGTIRARGFCGMRFAHVRA